MSNKLKYSLLGLLLTATAALGGDLLIKSRGNIIFETGGSYVKINKPLKVGSVKSVDGSGPAPGGVPIGGVVAVVPNIHANLWQPPATGVIKDGFMRANGAAVPACSDCKIPTGTVLPDMVGKYIKGGTSSNTVTTRATVTLTAANIPAITKSSLVSTGALNSSGVAITHTHPAYHTHGTSDTTSTHTHTATHTHSISPSQDGMHTHTLDLNGNSSHSHTAQGPAGHSLSKNSIGSQPITFAFNQTNTNASTYNGLWRTTSDGSHTHTFSSAGVNPDHNHNVTLSGLGTTPSGGVDTNHTHTTPSYSSGTTVQSAPHTHTWPTMTIGNASPGSITLAGASSGLSYTEVVWVIRVK